MVRPIAIVHEINSSKHAGEPNVVTCNIEEEGKVVRTATFNMSGWHEEIPVTLGARVRLWTIETKRKLPGIHEGIRYKHATFDAFNE
jgi:hypothetical protein